jgi:hypothetical protein
VTATIDSVIADQLPVLAARAHLGLGQADRAEAVLLEKYGTREQVEGSQPAIMSMLACCQGRLGDATRLAIASLQAAEQQDIGLEWVDVEARLVLAEVCVERNQLEAAWQHLQAAVRLHWLSRATSHTWAIEIDLVRVLVAQGRVGEAVHRLEQLEVVGAGFLSQPQLQKICQLAIECRLELGDTVGGLQIAKSRPARDIPRETLARLDLCSGRPDQAIARLTTARSSNLAVEIRRLVLLACAEQQQGQIDRAASTIWRAVDAGRREGFVRPFLVPAAQTLRLLRGHAGSSGDRYMTQLIGEAERHVPPSEIADGGTVLEPFTERERQVLRYLATTARCARSARPCTSRPTP